MNDEMRVGLSKVAVALDTADWEDFRELCAVFGPRVGVLKVGLEAYTRWGPEAVSVARDHGAAVFLDLKLHDIPNTVAGAVRAVADLGVDYLTLHAAGGPPMLEAAVEAAAGRVRLLAVTLLTHLDRAMLVELDLPGEGRDRARSWARMAAAGGCDGAVCSAHEAAALRAVLPAPFVLVTPGIRLVAVTGDDQARVAGPAEALAAGADLLVVGRPLTRAPDRTAALVEWSTALGG